MKLLTALATVVLALALPGAALAAPTKPAAKSQRMVLPTNVRPDRYDIRITPDAANLSFTGHVDIALTVVRATDRIVLNAADLTLGKSSLSGQSAAPRIVRDDKQETTAFVFARPLAPGRYTLSIDYAGKIYQQASGLFALDYEGSDGARKRALFTQFQNSDGRRFAPMWDEPGIKSVFALSVVTPEGQMPVSNMPIASDVAGSPGTRAIQFQDSPKMSSYLLFFALGEFERIHQKVGDTDVGVVVRKGDTEKGRYALESAVKLLGYYNDYFDTPYPLPKLDMIAGPGQSQFFSAMENWGAVFYFDYVILIDPKLSTESDKQNVFTVVAHELAHQWFGNLVTMEWWDDIWLNEGFASWLENKATDHFHPEWNIWLSSQAGQQGAMRLDSRAGTHPVITDIPDVFAAANAFDAITYLKGQAVIRMLESYVGEDAFRTGVRSYIKKHAYGNTVSDDLWVELDKASPRKVTGTAHDFTRQAGVPMIRVQSTTGGIVMTQERFGADAGQRTPRTWRTPVNVVGSNGQWQGIVSAASPVAAPIAGSVVVNAGQTSYFRTAYAPELWAKLAPGFAGLKAADQLGLLYDSRALGEIGVVPMSDFLALVKNAPAAGEPIMLQTLSDQLAALDWLFEGRPGRAAYRAFAINRTAPIAARLGWDAKAGEADNDAILRRSVLTTLGDLGDAATIAEARRRFERYLADPTSLRGAGRRTVLSIVASTADARIWEAIHQQAKASKDITDRARLYGYLGASSDPVLAARTLKLALSGEPSPTEAPGIINAVAGSFPEMAYDFAIANRAKVEALLEPTRRASYFPELATISRDPATLTKLTRYATTIPPSSRGDVEKAAASIRFRLGLIKDRVPEMERWLAANGG